MDYEAAVKNGRLLVEQAEGAEREASEARWELARLSCDVVESGVTVEKWAQDLDLSKDHVKLIRRTWRRYGSRRHTMRWTDAVELAKHTPDTAEGLEQEATAARVPVSRVMAQPGRDVPRARAVGVEQLLKDLIRARAYILRTLDAIRADLGPYQRPPTPEELEAIRTVAREIAEAAEAFAEAPRLRPVSSSA